MKDFSSLIENISVAHQKLQLQATNAINQSLTIRNWLIGYYIVEYEQNGKDRAKYGTRLIKKLAERLNNIKGLDQRSLQRFRIFYNLYPQIADCFNEFSISESLTPKLKKIQKSESATPKLKSTKNNDNKLNISGKKIITKLSFTHLIELIKIKNQLKRTFYELECIKCTWSVRELKRQIASLYFERSGLSANPEKLSKLVKQKTTPNNATSIIKNIYAFEFLDLKIKDVVEESDLETALLNHLQEFIIELGNGFCFEKRQKRILIGENYYFIDLVFYHRILKCHVIIELKIGEFSHGDVGQLNTYLNYFKTEICETNDNPPVGILLVADKNHALVKFATANMDKNLFVQQYLVQLPSKELLENYIDQELNKLR